MSAPGRTASSHTSTSRSPRRPARLVILAACLLVGVTGRASTQEPVREPPRPTDSGAVSGTVISATDGSPVVSALIEIEGIGVRALSNERGHFRLERVPGGDHVLTATRIGFAAATRRVSLASGGRAHVTIRMSAVAIETPGLVVTATRSRAAAEDLTASVSVLSSDDIEASASRTPDELVRGVAGVSLPRSSSVVSHPTAQQISIRGTGRNRTLVLLDGVPLNDPFGGWIRWNLVPKRLVERVEVVRGGGSSLFGSYAMGGVVQLFTRRPTEPDLHVSAAAGQRELLSATVYGAQAGENWGATLSGHVASGGGYVAIAPDDRGPVDIRSGSERRQVRIGAQWAPSIDSRLHLRASVFDEDRNGGTPLQRNGRTIGSFALGGELPAPAEGMLQGSLFGSIQRFDNRNSRTFDQRSREALTVVQEVPVGALGASLMWSREIGAFDELGVGVDARLIDGENRETTFLDSGGDETRLATGGRQLLTGVFAQGILGPEPWRIEASLRMDAWNNFDAFRRPGGGAEVALPSRTDVQLSPRLGIGFEVGERLDLRAAAYRAFRAPTLNELYRGFFASNLSFEPNPELGPETLVGGEVGADWRPAPGVLLSATGFWDRIEDQIEFVSQGGSVLRRENLGRTRLRGLEAEASFRPASRWTIDAAWTFIDSEILRAATDAVVGNRVPGVAMHTLRLRAGYEGPTLGEWTATVRYESERFEDDRNEAVLDDFVAVDLTGRRELRAGVELFLAAENLFDARIVTGNRRGLTELGTPRTLRGGLSVDIL